MNFASPAEVFLAAFDAPIAETAISGGIRHRANLRTLP